MKQEVDKAEKEEYNKDTYYKETYYAQLTLYPDENTYEYAQKPFLQSCCNRSDIRQTKGSGVPCKLRRGKPEINSAVL